MRDAKSADWDVVSQGRAKKERALYLQNCMREDDPGLLAAALGAEARAEGITLRRTTLYRLLAIDPVPSFSTILKVSRARGVKLYGEASPLGRRCRDGRP